MKGKKNSKIEKETISLLKAEEKKRGDSDEKEKIYPFGAICF